MRRPGARVRRAGPALGAVLLALLAGVARGEIREVESVGVVPIRARGGAAGPPKDAAVDQGLRDAVLRVARELLAGAGVEPDATPPLEALFAGDALQYTAGYRILEDRGEQRALFSEDPEVLTEYVVVVQGMVDVERVRERLVELGLLAPREPLGAGTRIRVDVRGLRVYPAYEAFRALLARAAGTERVKPLGFEPGRTLFLAESEVEAQELVSRLLREAAPRFRLDVRRPAAALGAPLGGPEPGAASVPDEAARMPTLFVRARWIPPPLPEDDEDASAPRAQLGRTVTGRP